VVLLAEKKATPKGNTTDDKKTKSKSKRQASQAALQETVDTSGDGALGETKRVLRSEVRKLRYLLIEGVGLHAEQEGRRQLPGGANQRRGAYHERCIPQAKCNHWLRCPGNILCIQVERHPDGHKFSVGAALSDQTNTDDPVDVQLFRSRIRKQGLQYELLPRDTAANVWKRVPADSILVHFSALTKAGAIPLDVMRVVDALLAGPNRME
jgi:hypothetical protein